MAFAAAAPIMAANMAAKLAPGVLGGLGGAVGGAFGKKGARAGKAVGRAIGGIGKKVFGFVGGGRPRRPVVGAMRGGRMRKHRY